MENMNMTQDPCQNFYEFACQGFDNDPSNPQDVRAWSALHEISKINSVYIKRLLEEDGNMYRGAESTAVAKAKLYYKSCMKQDDYTSIEPLLEMISELGSWTLTSNPELQEWSSDGFHIEDLVARAHSMGSRPLFGCTIHQDLKNATVNRIECDQSGMLLPSQGLYDDSKVEPYRQIILSTIARVTAEMSGGSANVTEKAQAIWDLDQRIAKAQDPQSARSKVNDVYHMSTLGELQDLMGPSFNMTRYLKMYMNRDFESSEKIILYAPNFLEKLGNITTNIDPETVQNYVVFSALKGYMSFLPTPYQDIQSDYEDVIYGTGKESETWEKCVAWSVGALGFAAGGLFAERHFTEDDKEKIVEMVELVQEVFTEGLPGLEWMDPATKETAMFKATEMIMKIGYPEFVANAEDLDEYYSSLEISNITFSNVRNSRRFSVLNNLKNYNQPVDRKKWYMTPSVVNAYYNPSLNEMVFPAGILQEPLYHRFYPRAMIYGAIGMVIAHELTHGFDNNGRLFDANGNLVDWWHNSSAVQFEEKAKCFVDQYDQFLVYGQNVNGKLTLGENIADNGGIRLAYNAYKKWLSLNNGVDKILPGLGMSSEQLFYLGYAQTWCSSYNKQLSLLLLIIDNHSPNKFRAEGAVMNSPEFASAYSCSNQDRMNPSSKCAIWT
ncbi:hypothetical protein CAPTEDRAFT_161607 [Capitella teleta]|uniref:Endothelin-converting enzyme 1 n=1 Tax=Capitella teleta TaxID=283909 RepID=N1PBD3_CAPTE|nr:hypothetical protein CAPTEDRAFT_161607 [Capitella teleta]|eukprot:ELU18854.1 hypothetical protein CAPTEDRAFT_161607 [Capitella teleta]